MLKKEQKKRTIADKLISGFNSVRYRCIEPVYLRIARVKHEKEYHVSDTNPLISIYTPTYNRGEILMQRAIPSALSQTYQNFELIILGDCCTDNTEELVSKIKDSRVKFYNLPRRGYRYPPTAENHWLAGSVVASNSALDLVRGKWIARLDDDDTWTSDHLELLLKFAQKGNYEFVSSLYTEERYGQKRIIRGERADGPYYNPSMNMKQVEGRGPKLGGVSTWLYRSYLKSFKYNINCWRKVWNRVNDAELSQRFFKAGVRMGFLSQSLAFVLPRPGEKTIGLEAYKKSEERTCERYKFD